MGFEEKTREKTEETGLLWSIKVMKCGEIDEENDGFSYGVGFDFAKLAVYALFSLIYGCQAVVFPQ